MRIVLKAVLHSGANKKENASTVKYTRTWRRSRDGGRHLGFNFNRGGKEREL